MRLCAVALALVFGAAGAFFSGKPPSGKNWARRAFDDDDGDEGLQLPRGASAVLTYGLGVSTPTLIATARKGKGKTGAAPKQRRGTWRGASFLSRAVRHAFRFAGAKVPGGSDFTGRWRLERSENFNECVFWVPPLVPSG